MGSFWGITADGWIAIATLASAVAILLSGGAVLYGIFHGAEQFLREQEARDLRASLVEDGTKKLARSIDTLLEAVRLNYTLANHLIRHVRDLPFGSPGAPRVEDLPRLVSLEGRSLGFEAIRSAATLLHCDDLANLATHAIGVLYNINLILITEIEQPIRSHYSGTFTVDAGSRAEFVKRSRELAQKQFDKAEEFGRFPIFVEMAGVRLLELRIARWDEIEKRFWKDSEVIGITANIESMWQELRPRWVEADAPP